MYIYTYIYIILWYLLILRLCLLFAGNRAPKVAQLCPEAGYGLDILLDLSTCLGSQKCPKSI